MIRTVVIGLVVGGAALALALWGVPLDELGRSIAEMDPLYLIHAALLYVANNVLRAVRQHVLVLPIAPAATFRKALSIVCVGFLCINTFPARLGEAVRPYLLWEREQVPLGSGFGVCFVERVIDLIALFGVLLAVVVWADVPERTVALFGAEVSLLGMARTAATVLLPPALLALIGLAAFGRPALAFGERIVGWVEERVSSAPVQRLARALLRFAESFVDGARVLRDPVRLLYVALLTAGIFWTMALTFLYLARSFDLGHLVGLGESGGVLVVTMLGIALPAPPGFAGVFEASIRAGLALFGVHGEGIDGPVLAFAVVAHWWTYLVVAGMGVAFLWIDGIEFGRLFRFARGRSGEPE